MTTKNTGTFLDDVKTTGDGTELRQVFSLLSKHKLNMIKRIAKDVKDEKYGDSGSTTRNLRGQRSEVFTEDMLQDLFIKRSINQRWRYTFIMQLFACMRPSEVSSLEIEQGYWRDRDGTEHDAFHLYNEKCDRHEYKPAPRFMKLVYHKWEQVLGRNDRYSAAYCNQVFQKMRERLGHPWDDENPVERADGTTSYLYSNKSIRHTSKALFSDVVDNDPYKVAHHMHHDVESVVGAQGAYGRYDPQEWKKDLKRAFLPYYELIRPECEMTDGEGLFEGVGEIDKKNISEAMQSLD